MKKTLVMLLLSATALAQTLTGKGSVIAKGTVKVGPQSSQYVRIFALFPPETDPDRSNHFTTYVMNQSAIDGVTDKVVWANVETGTPSATPCAGPAGTDVCQLDAFGWYHTYDWGSTDTTLSYWFSSTNGWGTKTVNIIGFSQTGPVSPTFVNSATPYYITTPSWIAHTGGSQNYINSPEYGCTSWTGPTVVSITAIGTDATVTLGSGLVSTANGYPMSPTANDIVWIQGTGTSLDTGTSGATITSVQQGSNTFHYTTGCSGCSVTGVGTAITSVQSWVVPYQIPMKTGLKAFIAAAIQHFGPNHSGIIVQPNQVYYLRFGKSVGGESFVYCTSHLPDFPPGTAYSATTWQNYITEMTNFEQAQSPPMLIFEPINRVGTDDTDYSNYEAKDAIAHGNTYGATFGFGSQGLSLYDSLQWPLNPCASNWCVLFNTYYAQGSPLELQQIANSDPTDQNCGTGGANCVPGGDSGDLRVWLPFAVGSRHMNVLELYSVDADLAFDPQFCVLNMGATMCITGSYGSLNGLSAAQQLKFFQPDATPPPPDKSGVGLGNTNSCYTGPGLQSSALGDCSYSTAINTAHGYH